MTMILNIDGSRSCVLMAQDLLTPLWEHQSLGTFCFLGTLILVPPVGPGISKFEIENGMELLQLFGRNFS